jgi:hypothetical protein
MNKAVFCLALVLSILTITTSDSQEIIDEFELVPVVWEADWAHSKHWAFVVDTSHSIFGDITGVRQNRFGKIVHAISKFSGSDYNKFCAVAFNDMCILSYVPYFKWRVGTPENLVAMEEWLNKPDNQGTMSYAGSAISRALKQRVKELTIFIISDGGFTEGPDVINKIIAKGQADRIAKGFGEAVICTIGIENHTPPGYPKPSDDICQSWMRNIGTFGKGGYFYVRLRK